ncbi:MAG: PepSY domain-containing protein [Hyphomicrobiales bacterium]
MNMKTFIAPALIAASVALAPLALADSDEKVSSEVAEQITAKLKAQGYEVREIEKEDDMFEAEAVKDGKRFELELDQSFEIVKMEEEDDEDDEAENEKDEDKG